MTSIFYFWSIFRTFICKEKWDKWLIIWHWKCFEGENIKCEMARISLLMFLTFYYCLAFVGAFCPSLVSTSSRWGRCLPAMERKWGNPLPLQNTHSRFLLGYFLVSEGSDYFYLVQISDWNALYIYHIYIYLLLALRFPYEVKLIGRECNVACKVLSLSLSCNPFIPLIVLKHQLTLYFTILYFIFHFMGFFFLQHGF